MKIALAILTLSMIMTTTSYADEGPIKDTSCGNADFSITVDLKFSGRNASLISWKKSRSGAAEQYKVVSQTMGPQLWEGLPGKWVDAPIGNYVAKRGDEKIVLSIAKPASMGGGGYSHEGVLTYFRGNDVFVWGMYCNNW